MSSCVYPDYEIIIIALLNMEMFQAQKKLILPAKFKNYQLALALVTFDILFGLHFHFGKNLFLNVGTTVICQNARIVPLWVGYKSQHYCCNGKFHMMVVFRVKFLVLDCYIGKPRKCVNSVKNFCYICGEVNFSSQKRHLTLLLWRLPIRIRHGLLIYVATDDDDERPNAFAVPMVWRQSTNHTHDWHLC